MPALAEPEIGVRYPRTRNRNGTSNIHGVPIMGPVPKGVRKAPEDIGEEWMRAAVATAKMREAEGYLAPLHVGHHDDGEKPLACGMLRVMRVGTIQYEGRETPCVFADFVNVPDRFAERFERGELPYRSVEIHRWDKAPEINSCALLDSEVPFFRLPAMVGLKDETLGPDMVVGPSAHGLTLIGAPMPLAAFRASANGGAALYRFPSGETRAVNGKWMPNVIPIPEAEIRADFADKPEKEGESDGDSSSGDKPKAGEDGGAGGDPGPADEDANDGDAPTDESPDDDPKVKAADEMLAGVMGKLDGIASTLAKIAAVLCPSEEPTPQAKPKRGLEPEDLNESGDVSHMSADHEEIATMTDSKKPDAAATPQVDAAQFAEMRGEIAALREKDKARETRDTIASLTAAARTELRDYNIGAETEADLAHFAALGKDPLDRFVASFRRTTPKDPAKTIAEVETAAAKSTDPAEIATFAAKLPEEKRGAYFTAARAAGAEYDAITKTTAGKRAMSRFKSRLEYVQAHPSVTEFAA